ncbi:MAG: phage portal protein [Clostridiales bacterium]|nr:phage portal protein [Clostridiales bacterium]
MSKPNLRERALFLLSPQKGNRAYENRMRKERLEETGRGLIRERLAYTGYGNHGASRTLNSLIGWLVGGGSAEDDIDLHGALLRRRARDLYAGGGLARSGPATMTTNVVGWGIHPKPKINSDVLGLSDEARDEWERNTLREFHLWASNVMCDATRQQDFFGMQQLAFRSMLVSGDVFALFGMKPNKRTPYQTTLRILEADRVCTPDAMGGESESKEVSGGGRIVDGVEIDREGAVVRYHIANRHPLMANSTQSVEWQAIEAFGRETGYPNILHVMTHERPEQRRGIPFCAAQIEQIKQLDRYINSELAANVVSSMLTAFLESDEDDGAAGMEDAVNEEERVTDPEDQLKLELAPGVIYDLPPGKRVKEINPIRSNSAFESFVTALETVIGASMGIPVEVLIKKYNSNYTAARGAMLDFWREVRVYRRDFNQMFNQPVYEQWLSEAVAIGRIEAPGFFDDPAIRQAWCSCMWMGVSAGHVDPIKEVKAAEMRIKNNITTQEQEAAEFNGNDWAENIRQRKKEMSALGAPQEEKQGGPGDGPEEGDDSEGSKSK